jgi:F-type H+-transporting ATPase subunit epsilon
VARNPFPVEILTPEGQVYSGEVEMLSTRTEVGEIGVLANHAPVLAMLAPAELRLHTSDTGKIRRFAQGEGYLQIHDNSALVLVEECIEPDAVDSERYREQLEKAEATIDEIGGHSSEEREEARFQQALRDKRRAETFLRVAGDDVQD